MIIDHNSRGPAAHLLGLGFLCRDRVAIDVGTEKQGHRNDGAAGSPGKRGYCRQGGRSQLRGARRRGTVRRDHPHPGRPVPWSTSINGKPAPAPIEGSRSQQYGWCTRWQDASEHSAAGRQCPLRTLRRQPASATQSTAPIGCVNWAGSVAVARNSCR